MQARFEELLAAWNRAHAPAYSVRACDLEWNLNQQYRLAYLPKIIAGTPAFMATATPTGIAAGLPAGSLWLSLWGEINDAKAFVKELCALPCAKLLIGGDEFHFTPGVPQGDEKFRDALMAAGFETYGQVADYVGDLRSSAVTEYVASARKRADEDGWSFELARDQEELRAFLNREFPGRWTREFDLWRKGGQERATWHTLRRAGVVEGFARLALRSRVAHEQGWSPAALRLPLDGWKQNDSCLGPIGVASSLRGQGAGRVLLGLVLEQLIEIQAGRVCIDWTNAFKYYDPLRFEIVRRYETAWRIPAKG